MYRFAVAIPIHTTKSPCRFVKISGFSSKRSFYSSRVINSESSSEACIPTSTPRITVIGVGGAGGNAVNTMIESTLQGVEFIIANTDIQSLSGSQAKKKIQLGKKLTNGLGAGSKPVIGKSAAEESLQDITKEIQGTNMLFITAGMGGGTGTGAAPIIAEAARNMNILTVGMVTTPFLFEGKKRMDSAQLGITDLEKVVDTLIVVPNQKLLSFGEQKETMQNSFKLVDKVLYEGIKSVTDLVVIPGMINLDFADVCTVMKGMGRAIFGIGEAEGRGRAKQAVHSALHNPLLEDIPLKEAKGVLINVVGGPDLTLAEVDEIASVVREAVDPDANIIFGSTLDEKYNGKVRVSVIITGMEKHSQPKIVTSPIVEAPKPDFWNVIKKYW